MAIIRPRLNDYHNLPFRQEDVDFVIPFLEEDIPFYIDPFLLWKSPSQQDNALHLSVVNTFNFLGDQFKRGNTDIIQTLIEGSECDEIGLGNSMTKTGKRIGSNTATDILNLYKDIPQVSKSGFVHFEEIQLLTDNIAEDRISDFAANFIKSFLIDYTIDQCRALHIPIEKVRINNFDNKNNIFVVEETYLPINPETKHPILLVPKRWLRHTTSINYQDYYKEYYSPKILKVGEKPDRIKVLNFNRDNYDIVRTYIEIIERNKGEFKNDPLFTQIPVGSVKKRLKVILSLPTGKTENADKKYEDFLCPLLASLFYPHLDFAQEQSRSITGVSIRDLIFYNNCSDIFLKEIYHAYDCKQIVFELKNVKEVNNDHVDQLNRYLTGTFGSFGIIFTRNAPPTRVIKNTIDLWSAHRKCILIATDEELKLMCSVYETHNRTPIEVLNKIYAEFTRRLPS
jgi:hypothetical protein